VLWILAALSALVLIIATSPMTAVVVAGSTDRVQTDALVTAAVELAAYQLTNVSEALRPTSGRSMQGRRGKVVTFRSEAARIDLNAAPKGLISRLMIGLGVNPSNAADYADRSWRGARQQRRVKMIPRIPFIARPGCLHPRHARFRKPKNWAGARGFPPLVGKDASVRNGVQQSGRVNVLDAAPQVVRRCRE